MLSWIVFQVGQALSLVGATAGVRSRLWLIETTTQANGGTQCNSALQGNGPNCTQAITDGVFQGQVGAWAPWKKDLFFHLIWVLELKVQCYTHEIWFHTSDSGSTHLQFVHTVPTMPTSTQKRKWDVILLPGLQIKKKKKVWIYWFACIKSNTGTPFDFYTKLTCF